jgi:hypothetical protein
MATNLLSVALRSLKPFKKQDPADLRQPYHEHDDAEAPSNKRSLAKVDGVRSGGKQHIVGLEILPNNHSESVPFKASDRVGVKEEHNVASCRGPHRNVPDELPIEVLQQIFSHLDLLTLFKCRCVCTLWNSCIPGDSPELREAMFLPGNAIFKATEWPPFTLFFEIYTDADMARRFSAVPPVRVGAIDRIVLSHVSRSSVALHPFISQIGRYLVPRVPQLQRPGIKGRTSEDFHFTYLKNKAGNLFPPEDIGSLSGMLVSMRPVTELHVNFRYIDCNHEEIGTKQSMRQCILYDKDGVTLAHVFRVIEKQIMGLLRDETLRQIGELPVFSGATKDLRERLLYTVCPVKGKMTFLRCQ